MRVRITAIALAGLTACSLGGSVAGWRPSGQAAGSEIVLDLGNLHRVQGELITLDSAGFLILQDGRLIRVDPLGVRSGSAYKTDFDFPISRGDRERLRLMSRYPQGVSAEVERALLDAYGLSQIEIVAAPDSQP